MNIYQISREFYPFANAGGLKEVLSGLATAFINNGHNSSVFIPCYGFINKAGLKVKEEFFLKVKDKNLLITIYYQNYEGVNVYLFDYPAVADKNSVYTYTYNDELNNHDHKKGTGFIDSDEINIIFQLSFLKYITEYVGIPDILSLHDGHTGVIPALIKNNSDFNNCKIFFTIHNAGAAYHQRSNALSLKNYEILDNISLCEACFDGNFDPLCSAVLHSSAITVSPFYAEEIKDLVHEESSGNFGAFCNDNNIKIHGITNGVNLDHYSGQNIFGLPKKNDKLAFRAKIKSLLKNNYNFEVWGDINLNNLKPLILFQNRITEQKGIKVFIDAFKRFANLGSESIFVAMGQGENEYEQLLISLAQNYPEKFCYIQGYDKNVAESLFLSSDFFILTSLWEPCGLTDFEAQLAGSIPIVHKTGGLQKVIDGTTGFVYQDLDDLVEKLKFCEKLYLDKSHILDEIKIRAYDNIVNNYTWDKVFINGYLPLFES